MYIYIFLLLDDGMMAMKFQNKVAGEIEVNCIQGLAATQYLSEK